MQDLTQYPNIGKVLASQLHQIGITSLEELQAIGSVAVAVQFCDEEIDVCASKLFALEGAIRGIRWHQIPQEERDLLRAQLEEARAAL